LREWEGITGERGGSSGGRRRDMVRLAAGRGWVATERVREGRGVRVRVRVRV